MAAHFPFAQELIHQGNLVDGQRVMVGLVGAVALVMGGGALARLGTRRLTLAVGCEPANNGDGTRVWRGRIPLWPLLIGLLAAAEILVMKRGSWFSTGLVLIALGGRRLLRWRRLLPVIFLLALLAVGVAPVRQRLADLRTEFTTGSGGRLAMWTEVAPVLLKAHPWGIGFRAMTSERMREIAPRIERDRDHLHSNFVEMAVSLGWAGLALYLVWMAFLMRDALAADAAPRPLFWMILALFLNGVVEYNFADAEIVILLGLLGGLAAAGRRLRGTEEARHGDPGTIPA
jgi:O-antigen ligase